MAIYAPEAEDFEPIKVGQFKSKFSQLMENMAAVEDFINQVSFNLLFLTE